MLHEASTRPKAAAVRSPDGHVPKRLVGGPRGGLRALARAAGPGAEPPVRAYVILRSRSDGTCRCRAAPAVAYGLATTEYDPTTEEQPNSGTSRNGRNVGAHDDRPFRRVRRGVQPFEPFVRHRSYDGAASHGCNCNVTRPTVDGDGIDGDSAGQTEKARWRASRSNAGR